MLDKGCTTIKGALNELDAAGLLERRRTGFSAANRLYVKVPPIPVVQFSDQLTDGKPPLIRAGNRPTDSRKTDLMTVGKPSPNQTNINNLIESQTKRASEGQPPAAYGRYKNVFLSDTELLELEQDFPDKWEYYIDRLSCHMPRLARCLMDTKLRGTAKSIWPSTKRSLPLTGRQRIL